MISRLKFVKLMRTKGDERKRKMQRMSEREREERSREWNGWGGGELGERNKQRNIMKVKYEDEETKREN